ncbi:amino acid adenylation domain-containing protein [Catenisphaera adipataccumulans]|uniref:Amino acid adenylation domain-containing protein n=1 Tax=Catenisphaera adipataccumulans TaxID=700500 RepID=A0A7W8CYD0_9FIRM|nr:amino acid adenylation domain-containing protein [Catenisphaera adipataccumulans]MBB5182703.1 amino acid adenylation domain-containing protein [Catenisphaera adipataccumulans]
MNQNETIYHLFRQMAERYPDQPAVLEKNRTLTFRELLKMTDQLAAAFPENIRTVGIIMDHEAEMIAAMLAVLKCGARYVPAEPTFPIGRIRYMMSEAQVDFILVNRAYQPLAEGFDTKITACVLCAGKDAAGHQDASVQPSSPAYVLYTSGTTGRPKGVCVTNQNVCHYAHAFAHEFHPGPGDVMLQYSVCSFDIFTEEVFASLLNGAAIAIPSSQDKADLQALMNFVQEHHVTMLSGFPYLLADLNHLDHLPDSLRLLISGGDVLRGSYVDHLLDQALVYNTYGPSETTVCASYYCCNTGHVLEDGTYPVGKAVEGTVIKIMDADGKEVPAGQTGEICIFGDGVSNGYIGDHAEENKAFVRQADGSVMYRSGDLGYLLPDGSIAFLHRKDSQIMILGKRVEVKEVESRLYQCRHVRQAVVRPCVDETGLSYMTAYIVPADDDLKLSEVRRELAENLTSFMIPEFFVRMPSIPLNANGKPDFDQMPLVMKEGTY